MESPAYAGHLLVADTITRIMNERNSRQDAAFERLLAVLERMAPAPSSKEPPATGGTASPGGRSGTTPSDGPPRSDPSTAPSVIMAPPSSAPRRRVLLMAPKPGSVNAGAEAVAPLDHLRTGCGGSWMPPILSHAMALPPRVPCARRWSARSSACNPPTFFLLLDHVVKNDSTPHPRTHPPQLALVAVTEDPPPAFE
ncbi:unnamed protein product [Closterium sp. Naga37s-1]|nr:unnamed protein product [Closterium sp. Naga37s-1]